MYVQWSENSPFEVKQSVVSAAVFSHLKSGLGTILRVSRLEIEISALSMAA
jgi:hypothetical protein